MILSIPVLSPVLKRFLIRHIPSPGNAYFKKKLEPETSVWIHDDEKPRCDYFKLRKSFYAPPLKLCQIAFLTSRRDLYLYDHSKDEILFDM